MADELHYVPMPDNVVQRVEESWASDIKGADGKPILATN
jgi:phosphate transport system substrate-binding protein